MAARNSSLCSVVMDARIATKLSWIPRKVRVVEGPSVFSGLIGTLIAEQAWIMGSMLDWHVLVSGGPAVKKSSR